MLITVAVLSLLACDCVYDYEFIIQNNTGSRIKIYFVAEHIQYATSLNGSLFLGNDSAITIFTKRDLWVGGGCPGPCIEDGKGLVDSVYITMNDSMKTTLNYTDINNWIYSDDNEIGTFKIILDNNDFIKVDD